MNSYLDKIRKLTETELKENGRFMLQKQFLNKSDIYKITVIEPFEIEDNNTIHYNGKYVATVSDEIGTQIMNCTFDGMATLTEDSVTLSPSPITLRKR